MAATLEQIIDYLDEREWKYIVDSAKSRILTGVEAENVKDFLIAIALKENGEYLEIAAPSILKVEDHIYKCRFLQTLLTISYNTKMIRWEYDPTDGEVRASIVLPLEDSILTEKQFNRGLNGLIQILDESIPRLQQVLETGEDPGEKQFGEQLLLTLQEILPGGALILLEQAMQDRKLRGVSQSSSVNRAN